jgi:hypothetical protein
MKRRNMATWPSVPQDQKSTVIHPLNCLSRVDGPITLRYVARFPRQQPLTRCWRMRKRSRRASHNDRENVRPKNPDLQVQHAGTAVVNPRRARGCSSPAAGPAAITADVFNLEQSSKLRSGGRLNTIRRRVSIQPTPAEAPLPAWFAPASAGRGFFSSSQRRPECWNTRDASPMFRECLLAQSLEASAGLT